MTKTTITITHKGKKTIVSNSEGYEWQFQDMDDETAIASIVFFTLKCHYKRMELFHGDFAIDLTIAYKDIESDEELSEQNALLDQKLYNQLISVRTLNLLKANGIETVRDLVRLKKEDWLKFRNSGRKSLTELSDWLELKGLQWGMNV